MQLLSSFKTKAPVKALILTEAKVVCASTCRTVGEADRPLAGTRNIDRRAGLVNSHRQRKIEPARLSSGRAGQ